MLFDRVPSGLRGDVAKIVGVVAMFYSVERSYVGEWACLVDLLYPRDARCSETTGWNNHVQYRVYLA